MSNVSTNAPSRKLYSLVYDSQTLTNMLRKFESAVNDSISSTRKNFKIATDGRDGLAFVIEKGSQAVPRLLLSRLFGQKQIDRFVENTREMGFVLIRGKKEIGFFDIASGNSFKFNLPGLELRVEENASFIYDTGKEDGEQATPIAEMDQLVLGIPGLRPAN
jgi:hypothetical protein